MSRELSNAISQAEYDAFCDTTDHYALGFPGSELAFYALGYAGESGEVANKIKKVYRDDKGTLTTARRDQIIKEMGGAYWYFSRICQSIGVTPNEIRQANYEELRSRKERGTILGDGDDR
jgi:NTP pyrophosphatase (non-canonical NTP hydrolase)